MEIQVINGGWKAIFEDHEVFVGQDKNYFKRRKITNKVPLNTQMEMDNIDNLTTLEEVIYRIARNTSFQKEDEEIRKCRVEQMIYSLEEVIGKLNSIEWRTAVDIPHWKNKEECINFHLTTALNLLKE